MSDQTKEKLIVEPTDEQVREQGREQHAPQTGGAQRAQGVSSADPVCPHCGGKKVALRPIAMGTLQVLIFYCGVPECSKIFNLAPVGVHEPRVVAANSMPGMKQ